MNEKQTLAKAIEKLTGAEQWHLEEIRKIRTAKAALLRGVDEYKAPEGTLPTAILGVLGKRLMSNGEIRSALTAGGYTFSCSRQHVSKTLTALHLGKKVRKVGDRSTARYAKA